MTPRLLGISAAKGLLGVLEVSGGRVQGRAALHKLAFLLKSKGLEEFAGVPFSYEAYGPTSRELSAVLQDLVTAGFVREVAKPAGSGEMVFAYEIADAGRDLLRRVAAFGPELPLAVTTTAQQDQVALELAATVVYLERGRHAVTRADAVRRAVALNPARAAHTEGAARVLEALQL
jgi:uncharacterized protein YwgA